MGWRVCWMAVFSSSMRANRISPTRPISVLEISVSSVWRATIRGRRSASQGLARRFITISAHIGRGVGMALDQLVIDFAHLPDQLLVEAGDRRRQHGLHFFAPPRPPTAAAPSRRHRPRQKRRPRPSAPPGGRLRWRAPGSAPRPPAARISRRGAVAASSLWVSTSALVSVMYGAVFAGSRVWESQFQTGTRVPRAIRPFCLPGADGRSADPGTDGRTDAAAWACARNSRGAAPDAGHRECPHAAGRDRPSAGRLRPPWQGAPPPARADCRETP